MYALCQIIDMEFLMQDAISVTNAGGKGKSLIFWRISTFWVLLIGYIGYYLCRANLPAAYPLLSHQFGFTNSQLGLIAFYSEIAYAIGKFINGSLGDKIGGKKVFLGGMAGAIAFNLLFTQFTTLTAFIVIWCCCRYFLSMGWGGIVKTIGAWYPPERNGTIMGWISINFQFGGVVAALFAGYLVARGVGWRGLFAWPAAILLVILIGSWFLMKESPHEVDPHFSLTQAKLPSHAKGTLAIIGHLLKLSLFRQLLVFSLLTTFLRSIFFFWTAKFLSDIGMKDSLAIISSALFPLLGCIGTVFLGWYTDHYAKDGDRAKMMWIMLVGLAVSLAAIAFLSEPAWVVSSRGWIVVLSGVAGFCLLGPYSMSAGCLTLDLAGAEAASTAAGWIDGIGYFGGALAVWLTGFLSDRAGWTEVFLMLTAFALLSALSAFLMSWSTRKDKKAAAIPSSGIAAAP